MGRLRCLLRRDCTPLPLLETYDAQRRYAGVIVGGLTVLIWKQFAWFDLYELVPGFLFSVIAIIVVSLLDKEPSESIKKTFEKALALSK